jgi:hypothetical protein
MTARRDNGDLLSSWKEIANYLGCDNRTCRRWELSLGLPIHRMEGTAKSRVYAYKGELDSWRKEKLNGGFAENNGPSFGEEPATRSKPEGAGYNGEPRREFDHGMRFRPGATHHESKSNPLGRRLVWLVPAAAAILAAVFFLTRPHPGEPANFKIEGSKLIVLDEKGKPLWPFDTKLDRLISEQEYRTRFQKR